MAQIIVRNLDESTKDALKQRAARRGTSMESEARSILEQALRRPRKRGLGSAIRARFASVGGTIDLEPLPAGKLRAATLPK
jgi:antitoxin FitA